MGCTSSKPDVKEQAPTPAPPSSAKTTAPADKNATTTTTTTSNKVAEPPAVAGSAKDAPTTTGDSLKAPSSSSAQTTSSSSAQATTTNTASEKAPPATPPHSTAPTSNEEGDDDAPNSPPNNENDANLETQSVMDDDVPLMRYGQLRKQSGGMLVKNWRRRNFTVEKGILKYYELFIKEYPYGEREKGCFSLRGYTVVSEPNAREPNQILLQSSENRTFDLLVEADDAKKKVTWVAIFSDHIAYADKYKVEAPPRVGGEDAKYKTSTRF